MDYARVVVARVVVARVVVVAEAPSVATSPCRRPPTAVRHPVAVRRPPSATLRTGRAAELRLTPPRRPGSLCAMRRTGRLLPMTLLVAILVAGCGSAGPAPTVEASFDGAQVTVRAVNVAFEPAEISLPAGTPLRIILDNQDSGVPARHPGARRRPGARHQRDHLGPGAGGGAVRAPAGRELPLRVHGAPEHDRHPHRHALTRSGRT